MSYNQAKEKVAMMEMTRRAAIIFQNFFPQVLDEWLDGKTYPEIVEDLTQEFCLQYAFSYPDDTVLFKGCRPAPLSFLANAAGTAVRGYSFRHGELELLGLSQQREHIDRIKKKHSLETDEQFYDLMDTRRGWHYWQDPAKIVSGAQAIIVPSDIEIVHRLGLLDTYRFGRGDCDATLNQSLIKKTIDAVKGYDEEELKTSRMSAAYSEFRKSKGMVGCPRIYHTLGQVREHLLDENLTNGSQLVIRRLEELCSANGKSDRRGTKIPSIEEAGSQIKKAMVDTFGKDDGPYQTQEALNLTYFDAMPIVDKDFIKKL